ncbi:MAG: hypothetical protein AAB270_05425 [Chloroflexota bacterium]
MPRELRRSGLRYYICEVCGFAYLERAQARACEEFCTRYHGCSIDITQHAVEVPKSRRGRRVKHG